jgi:hypothetical protein
MITTLRFWLMTGTPALGADAAAVADPAEPATPAAVVIPTAAPAAAPVRNRRRLTPDTVVSCLPDRAERRMVTAMGRSIAVTMLFITTKLVVRWIK